MLGLYDYTIENNSRIVPSDFDFETPNKVIDIDAEAPSAPSREGSAYHSLLSRSIESKHQRSGSLSLSSLTPTSSISSSPPLRTTRLLSVPETENEKRQIQRKVSRKLPPRLTESLENLALSVESSPKTETASSKIDSSQPRTTEVYTLQVAPSPIAHDSYQSPTHSLEIARIGRPLTISNPSVPSTPTMPRRFGSSTITPSTYSSHLLTPSSSVRQFPRGSVDCSSGSASTCGTWSLVDEIELAERAARSRKDPKKETKKERKERKVREKEEFDETTPPSMKNLYEASLLDVIAEDGRTVKFGDLVRSRKTIVIFIRHWLCPLCAQYMQSIISQVNPETLEEAGVDLVIIGNGSKKMLPSYRNKAFHCPFPIYTDPTLALYRAMGLTRQTGDAGPDSEAGDYLVQSGLESTIATLKRATQMPLRNPGHFLQLGGEFVFNSTLNVVYTHRMLTTRSHSPIRDVCAAAGVRLEWVHYEPGPPPPPVHRHSVIMEEMPDFEVVQKEIEWKAQRNSEVERMKMMKEARRMGARWGDARRPVKIVRHGEESDEVEDEESLSSQYGALGLA